MTRFWLEVIGIMVGMLLGGAILAWAAWKIGGPSDYPRR